MQHKLSGHLLERVVKVAVIGAGGTGSQVLLMLAQMAHALTALGHPGFDVSVFDDDTVSTTNIGRQMFFPADVGQSKAHVLVNRINLTMNTSWHAHQSRINASDRLAYDLVIGCVDTRLARFNIMRAIELGTLGSTYWLDFGNRKDSGQAILGQVTRSGRKTNRPDKLPHVGELFPEVIDPKIVDPDEGPSCSLAEALERQSLFVNRGVAVHGMNLLWELFRHGEISHHGIFVDLKTNTTRPVPVDQAFWKRMGYGVEKRHFRKRKQLQAA